MDEIKKLEQEILRHKELYYNGQPEISDQEYDRLEDRLRALLPDSSVLLQTGASVSGETKWRKIAHSIEMRSLNKANSVDDVRDWLSKVPRGEILWSEKMDGISIALQYERGKLISAVTRGDGEVGEDIVKNVVLMRGIPRNLPQPISAFFRGEIVLRHEAFQDHFEGYSNPRNAASGVARVEDRDKAKMCQHLDVYVYEAFLPDQLAPTSLNETLEVVRSFGFKTPNYGLTFEDPSTPILSQLAMVHDRYAREERATLPYDIDGLVLRVNDNEVYQRSGLRNNRPLAATAWKFDAEGSETYLRKVEWQVGSTGRVTPVAHFDTVNLAGADVSKASLYNVSYIDNLGIKINDRILVMRVNDVIPRVEALVSTGEESIEIEIPSKCPSCEAPLVLDGEHLECIGSECPSKLQGDIQAWIEALGLLDWGQALLEALVSSETVKSPADLYRLDVITLADMRNSGDARLGESRATALLEALHAKKALTLSQFVGGLNISMCRDRMVQKLVQGGFGTLAELQQADAVSLASVKGFGMKKAASLTAGLQSKRALIEGLLEHVKIEDAKGSLLGKSFCITGSLSESRKVIEKRIKDQGGQVKSSVSSDLDYLVCNDPTSTSSKAKKARSQGTPIISEEDLANMM